MAVREILLLGDAGLYEISVEVERAEIEQVATAVQDLHDTIMEFKKKNGFGRAIAAPQIGIQKRLIYMYIDKPMIFINPVLTLLGEEKMELWDDCMSFPGLFVRVNRHKKCSIEYYDIDWNKQKLALEGDLSELLQHEYDHLDGILAVQRAVDDRALAFGKAIGK